VPAARGKRPAMSAWHGGARLPIDLYGLISARCERSGTDAVRLRLPGSRSVVAMRGEPAAHVFYDTERFQRAGAAPRRLTATLFGDGGVQALDGDAHRRRKGLFLALMGPEALADLRTTFADDWDRYAQRWARTGREVVLYDELGQMLCETACSWAGVPLEPADVAARTRDMHAMIESPAAVGPRHRRGRRARDRSGPLDLVPQGGGHHETGHRCPGEWATIDLMKTATHRLAARMDYDVPPQDLRLSRRKMPALPNSGFVISDVRPNSRTPDRP
jgi:cytochrome P450